MPRVPFRALVTAALIVSSLSPAVGHALQSQAAPPLERLVLTPAAKTTFRVQVVYPNTNVTCEYKRKKDLQARFRGVLEIVRQSDGRLALINRVTFSEYLQGLSEMPRSWPADALKAQVVAGRSYALYHLQHPPNAGKVLGYDICSTDQCQVYRGASVEQGPFGEAWVRAVSSTRGQVLRYHGGVIQAFYHSTSPGTTKRAFPGGTPQPYLSSVAGQDDAAPLAHWTVRIPLAHVGPILAAAGDWPGGAVTSVKLSGTTVSLSGGGKSKNLSKSSFRSDLNTEGPCVYPDVYPGPNSSGKKLPQTVPSIDFSMSQSGDALVLTGRGWGHGVGMSQYGAKALAEKGEAYPDILAYYYAGIRPETVTEPGIIRVLVAEDASVVRLAVEGSAKVTTATGSTLAPGDRFEVAGGPSLQVRRGIGPTFAPVLTVELASTEPATVPLDGAITLTYTLSNSSLVSLVVSKDGAEVVRTPKISQVSGPNGIILPLGTAAATTSPNPSPSATFGPSVSPTPLAPAPLMPGTYSMVLEVSDGLDTVRTAPVELTVEQAQAKPAPSVGVADRGGNRTIFIVVAIALGLAAAAGVLLRSRKKNAGRTV